MPRASVLDVSDRFLPTTPALALSDESQGAGMLVVAHVSVAVKRPVEEQHQMNQC